MVDTGNCALGGAENARIIPSGYESLHLVTVWIGEWKGWINIHLATCAANPTVQWLFLHDQEELPEFRPVNVTFLRVTLEELRKRFRTVCQKEVSLFTAYKVCDIKPVLGAMFPEQIPKDGWWGYCDSDILWGDIRAFLTEEDFRRYDVISSHVCSIIGQLTAFRSPELAKRLFLRVDRLDESLLQASYTGIDELRIDAVATDWERTNRIRVSRRMLQVWERLYQPTWEDWASTRESERLKQATSVHFPLGPCKWSDGKLYHRRSGTEYMFFHFLEWKAAMDYPRLNWPMKRVVSILVDGGGMHFEFGGNQVSRSLPRMSLWWQITLFRYITRPWKAWSGRGVRVWNKFQCGICYIWRFAAKQKRSEETGI